MQQCCTILSIVWCIPHSYNRTVFCDVTGRETRLPLRIKGEGLGPKLQFSFDSLNIENVFVNSSHAYEVSYVFVCNNNSTTC